MTTLRPPMKPADIRRRAYGLMRQCWLTLMIAAVLMSLFGWVKDAVEAHGEKLALQAYNAHMEAFYEATDVPTEEAINALNSHRVGEDTGDWTEAMEYASWYESKEWLVRYDANELYNKTFQPWELAGYAIDLIDLIFSCVVAVRLSRGMLTALRSGECTPHCLLSGWERIPTTAWLAIMVTLRILGWALLPIILTVFLSGAFGSIGELIGLVLMGLVAIWAELHYALAEIHLANDQDGVCTATDCLRYSVDDMDQFTIRAMLRTLWPIYAVIAVSVLFAVVSVFVPLLTIPAEIFSSLSGLFIIALRYACYVCVFDEMRQRDQAMKDANPPTEGLSRARALAVGESAD